MGDMADYFEAQDEARRDDPEQYEDEVPEPKTDELTSLAENILGMGAASGDDLLEMKEAEVIAEAQLRLYVEKQKKESFENGYYAGSKDASGVEGLHNES